ncbi:hypothetical protein [Blastomonas sp.]|uniref:hypothetical protein n=1 Tax=Blastomonas sp. TaxID=1909299 RepID=UPI00260BEECB|nr:hypothetical protein [Blastomonas sp.]MDM7955424.1 hypothetical protein [Blastomonas sp.]
MAEPKPIASLSSGLLARKGAARPAMRRQGLGMGGMMSHPMPEGEFIAQDDLGWNDMGYDVDPAHDEHAPDYGNLLAGAIPDALPTESKAVAADPAPEPVVPDVVRQQAEIAERMAEPYAEPVAKPSPEPEPPAVVDEEPVPVRKRKVVAPVAMPADMPVVAVPQGRRAAFTLRLDSERHLKLRLASAVTGQSAQALVTAALDELLTKIPEIEDLAGRVPRSAER